MNKLKNLTSKSEDGFTLIELLIVIVIIGILAAVAIPIFLNQQKAAVDSGVVSDVRNTVTNVALAQTQNPDLASVTVSKNATGAQTGTGIDIVATTGDVITAIVAADGTYTVSGYNAKGDKYKDTTHVFKFDSTTGKYGTAATV